MDRAVEIPSNTSLVHYVFVASFVAGAMLFVTSDEMVPESHCKGFEKEAAAGVMTGFVVQEVFWIESMLYM